LCPVDIWDEPTQELNLASDCTYDVRVVFDKIDRSALIERCSNSLILNKVFNVHRNTSATEKAAGIHPAAFFKIWLRR
jgi:hypothetical protein